MERIKKAIERAREERNNSDSSLSSRSITPERPVVSGAHESIQYTHTRTIHVDEEVLKKNRVVAHSSENYDRDTFRLLRTQVLQKMRSHNWNALAVTSARAGEGKSLVAINLAIALAMEVNQTVLLVDLDMRRPSIQKYFDYVPDKGIGDFLLQDTPMQEILINPGIERLVILPGREPIFNSSEMLSSPKMVALVEELKTRYPSRIVIFDLPPLLATDDALAFSPYVDSILLVAEEGKTSKEDLKQVKAILKNSNIIGTVLNKMESSQGEPY
ncbi:Tyrosine-protein kinase EpsD [hydrothermal vent metagenome]|uniref:non-specific protein-tyrosine kinase n=1 Tax=hydrothermal vent metagenome TaxID=652676 RepID=A0A3B1BDQ5_9ZZZZ